MTVSMRVMSAGDGYKYLLRTVVAGDGDRSLSTPLTHYYSAEGTPPGRWLGSGLAGRGEGQLVEGQEVSEAQLQLLIGMGRNPLTGAPLGHAYHTFKPAADRVAQRAAGLGPTFTPTERTAAIAQIEREESKRNQRRAVAGFDFTFSIPKSASVLWAVADAPIQRAIADAHHAAVAGMIAYIEREVACTRTGASNGTGAVAQAEVLGLIATAYDHYDSRAGDPHLHTHVVISNKVQTAIDGRWRSLDSRPMHAAAVAISELHEAVFADHLTHTVGVSWESRDRGRDRNPGWSITSVPETLVAEFSSRSQHINASKDQLIAGYVERHGHRPSAKTIIKLRAQATLAARPAKTLHSLVDLTEGWRTRASELLGEDAASWAAGITARPLLAELLRAEDVPLELIQTIGEQVVEAVSAKRSTWRRWNLIAEATRQTKAYRFASFEDREAVTGLVTDAAECASLKLTPAEISMTPLEFRRADGASVFRPKNSTVYTSHVLIESEDRLLALA